MSFMKKYQNIFIPIGLFVLFLILLYSFKNTGYFTDEMDNMLAAISLSKGNLIYTGFASQHMPFMYYFLGFFTLFGVHTIAGFRIATYFSLALLWVLMYVRYSKYFGKVPMILYPIFYIGIMAIIPLANTILSELFQAQFLVILLLELLLFYQKKKLSTFSKIIIPLCMCLAVGVAFVSAIPCLIFVLALFYLDIKFFIQKNESFSFIKYIQHFFKEYYLVLLVGIGFVFSFLAYLYFTGSLSEFYNQAFRLNTEVYSKYNGYSSNPIVTIIKCVPYFAITLVNAISTVLHLDLSIQNALLLIYCSGAVYATVQLWKKDKLLSLMTLLFVIVTGNRDFVGFHSTPFAAMSVVFFLLFLSKWKSKFFVPVMILLTGCFMKPMTAYIMDIFEPVKIQESSYVKLAKQLTNEDDTIFNWDMLTSYYLEAQRMPAGRFYALVPWFAEWYEDDLIEELKENRPKIISYNPNNDVWGYYYRDYAPNLIQYIETNYTFSNELNLWIRHDFIEEAENILKISIPRFTNGFLNHVSLSPIVNNPVEQFFVAETDSIEYIGLKFNTYNRDNYSSITLTLKDELGKVLTSETISAMQLQNNGYYRFMLNVPLRQGEAYSIILSSKDTNYEDYVSVYREKDKQIKKNWYAVVNNQKQNFNLMMEMK